MVPCLHFPNNSSHLCLIFDERLDFSDLAVILLIVFNVGRAFGLKCQFCSLDWDFEGEMELVPCMPLKGSTVTRT